MAAPFNHCFCRWVAHCRPVSLKRRAHGRQPGRRTLVPWCGTKTVHRLRLAIPWFTQPKDVYSCQRAATLAHIDLPPAVLSQATGSRSLPDCTAFARARSANHAAWGSNVAESRRFGYFRSEQAAATSAMQVQAGDHG